MIEIYDVEYYTRREAAERDLADESNQPQIKRIHLELAASYAAKAKALRAKPYVPPKR